MIQVSAEANHIADLLRAQSELGLVIRQTQLDVSYNAEQLVDIVKQLTITTHLELQSINETAVSLKRNLISNAGLHGWLSNPAVYALFKSVLNG